MNPFFLFSLNLRFADLIIDEKRQQLIAVGTNTPTSCRKITKQKITWLPLPLTQINLKYAHWYLALIFMPIPVLVQMDAQLCSDGESPHVPWDCVPNSGKLIWVMKVCKMRPWRQVQTTIRQFFQPRWSPDNRLFYVSDKNNW